MTVKKKALGLVGFGRCGQGYIRVSAFNSRENVEEAMGRLASSKVLKP